jgi:hypothetical protein
MLIPIRLGPEAAPGGPCVPEEWSVIELNGTLHTAEDVSLNGLSLGQLTFQAPDKVSMKSSFQGF